MVTTESPAAVCRRRFTLDDYHRMGEAGILDEDDRVELIDGELIETAAIGGRHFACVNSFTMSFAPRLVGRAIVSVQNPVTLPPRSEPQPDIVLIRIRPKEARTELPKPDDVLLIVEVADTTLGYDRGTKLPLYAIAGIPEVWIVDIERRRVLVHRRPDGDLYREALVIDEGEIAPNAFPDLTISMDEIFG